MSTIIERLLEKKSNKFNDIDTKLFGAKNPRPQMEFDGDSYENDNGHYHDEDRTPPLQQFNPQLDMFRSRDIDPMQAYRQKQEVSEEHLRKLATLQAESLFLKLELKTTIPKAVMIEALKFVGAEEQADTLSETTTSLSFSEFRDLIEDVIYLEFVQLQREGNLRIPPAQELVSQLMLNAMVSIAGKNGENVIVLFKKGFEKAGLNFLK